MKQREMSEVSRRDETETLVARYEPKSDGQPVEIYCTATPARFYILKALAGTNSIGEPIAPFKVATGSGREMLNLVTQMGEAIAAGMLGWCSLDPVVALRGGTELTSEQCKAALDEAMTIVEAVGTTGIYTRYQKARQWMNRYYPAWV